MTLSRRVQSGAAWQFAARLFSSSVSFVVTAVVLARILPTHEYGIFNFYLTAFLLVLTLSDFGANRAAIRMVAAGEAPRAGAIRAALAFKSAVGAGAFVVLAGMIALGEEGWVTRGVLLLAALHVLAHGLGGASIGYEVDLEYRVPARSVVLGYGLFLAAGLLLAGRGVEDAAPYLVAFGAGIAAQNVMLYLAARRRGDLDGALDPALLRRLVLEAVPLGLSAVAVAIYFYTDTILLRPLRGEEDVAVYSVAYRLMTFGLMLPVLFSQVLFPVFTRCHERGAAVLRMAVERATFYLALLAAVAMAILMARAEDVLRLVFGADYVRSAPALRVLAGAMAVVYMSYPHTTALIAAGRAATFTRITLISALLNVAMNLAVLKPFGPVGAAATTLLTEGFVLTSSVVALRRLRGISGFSLALLGPLALFALLVLALRLPPLGGAPLPVALVGAGAVAVAGALVLRAWPFSLGVDRELA